MITSTYVTEQVARYSRQEREAAAAASRVAREARASRRQRIARAVASPAPATTTPDTVSIPRQRRWIDAVVSSGN